MDPYVTGAAVKALREQRGLTQLQLAERLSVSDKAISKWETGRGYPDITLLEPLADALSVSVAELLSGSPIRNANISAHMPRSCFYVCPVCGNILHSMGEAAVTCHGIALRPAEAERPDETHAFRIESVEDEWHVQLSHPMHKQHFISFLAAVSADRMELVKLYPEGPAEARFRRSGVTRFLAYCNRDGLFFADAPRMARPARHTLLPSPQEGGV